MIGKEKRRTNRYTMEASIRCSYFNLPVGAASAKTINYSQDGMFFVSEMAFYPGSAVLIQAKNDGITRQPHESTEGMRHTTIAEVRWCKKGAERPFRYQVGVKYYESWY